MRLLLPCCCCCGAGAGDPSKAKASNNDPKDRGSTVVATHKARKKQKENCKTGNRNLTTTMKLICFTLAIVSTCSAAASAFVPTTTVAIIRSSPIAIKAVNEDTSAIDHGHHGDTFHHNDALEEMYTAVAGIKEEKADVDLGDYEHDMLQSKVELENLMHTKAFRHALDSEDTYNSVPTDDKMPTSSMASQEKVRDKGVSHFEFAALKQKRALNKLMTSKLQGVEKSHDDDHSVHHFELSLLESHAALDKLMDEGSFKESLDSDADSRKRVLESLEKRVQIGKSKRVVG